MAKINKQIKGKHLVSHQGQGATFEQQESYDDSLLPDAVELTKLKELDPDIMSWIKDRTAREQNARHDFTDRRMGLLENGQRKAFRIDVLTVFCAFAIMIAGMYLSYLLLTQKEIVVGSIFGGATIIFAAKSFLSFRKNITPSESNPKK